MPYIFINVKTTPAGLLRGLYVTYTASELFSPPNTPAVLLYVKSILHKDKNIVTGPHALSVCPRLVLVKKVTVIFFLIPKMFSICWGYENFIY